MSAKHVLSCWLNTGNHAYLCNDCRRKGHRNGVTKAVAWGKTPQNEPCRWCGFEGACE